MSGTLYVVSTPIGNLGDLTARASEVLRTVDVVLCEEIPKRQYLANLPKVFKGTHVNAPGLRFLQGRDVTFAADRPFTAYADGDQIAELPATITVAPGTLRVLASCPCQTTTQSSRW